MSAAEPITAPHGAGQHEPTMLPATPTSPLVAAALDAARRWHAGPRRASDREPFIQHPLHVARLLHDTGCSDAVIAAGLLHDVLEDTTVTKDRLAARFGPEVAELVAAVSDDPTILFYGPRKRALRAQVADAGPDAAVLFAADKLAKILELSAIAERDPERYGPTSADPEVLAQVDHYHHSARLLQRMAPGHPLVTQLAAELDAYHHELALAAGPTR